MYRNSTGFKVFKFIGSVILFILLASLYSCKQKATRPEAEKHLRAFDAGLIKMALSIKNTVSISLLQEMAAVKNAPLPILSNHQLPQGILSGFVFDTLKGIYTYDSTSLSYVKTGLSDSIIVNYHSTQYQNNPVRFIISGYATNSANYTSWLPERINALLIVDNKEIMTIDHHISYRSGFPIKGSTIITMENFTIIARFNTRIRLGYGKVLVDFSIEHNNKEQLRLNTSIKARYSHPGSYVVKSLKFKLKGFPITTKGKINIKGIKKSNRGLASALNRHSSLRIFKYNDRIELGQLTFVVQENPDLLMPALEFNDGTQTRLEEFLLLPDQMTRFFQKNNFYFDSGSEWNSN